MSNRNIILYSKPNCMQCNFTKQFFENNNVEFTVKDVFESEEALAEVKEKLLVFILVCLIYYLIIIDWLNRSLV